MRTSSTFIFYSVLVLFLMSSAPAAAKKQGKRKARSKRAVPAAVETGDNETTGSEAESPEAETAAPQQAGAEVAADAEPSALDGYLKGSEAEDEPPDAAAEDVSGDEPPPWTFEVFAKEEYRFRHASEPRISSSLIDPVGTSTAQIRSGADHDLRLYFGGSIRDGRDRFLADLSFGLFADVDGFVSSNDPTALSSVYENDNDVASLGNSSPAALWFDVYTLYAEYHSDRLLALARGGRQVSEHGRPVTFDGAAVTLAVVRPYLDIFAFGGRTVHFFETDADLFEDFLGSGGMVIRPLDYLKFELDYRFLAEDTANDSLLIGGDPRPGRATQHSYGITGWFRLDDWWFVKATFRGLDSSPAHAGGSMRFEATPVELGLDLDVDAQLVTLGEVNELDDPYYAVLGRSLPHVKLNADLWKSFTTDIGIFTGHAGWASRILTGGAPTTFNRDYGRAYLTFQAADLGVKGPFFAVTGEMYYTHAGSSPADDRFFTAGGSLGYDTPKIKGEAGTYYQWVKYTYYTDVDELQKVRTYFAAFRIAPVEAFGIRLKYEFEQFDRNIHTVLLTLTQTY